MFAVYGSTGQIYRGPLEEALQVRKVGRADALHHIEAFGQELKQASSTQLEQQADLSAKKPLHTEALQAYSEMLPEALERGPLLLASQIMQTEVLSLHETDTAQQAWQKLRAAQIHQAPVLNVKEELVGILHLDDMLAHVLLRDGKVMASAKNSVAELMNTPVIAAHAATDIRRIAAVMLEQGSGGVPIINENGGLIGFVSRTDIVRAVVHEPPLNLWT